MKEYKSVQYELLRPSEVKLLREKCSVVYIPVGTLEWHGVHNPLGTDGLKAHAICCEAALRHGGVVLPPIFLGIMGDGRGWGPEGWDGFSVNAHDKISMEDTIFRTAHGLVANDWKVLVGVTGHDVEYQRDAMHNGIQRACKGSDAKGFAICEGENWQGGTSMKYSMDHAATWETSAMLFAHNDRVCLDELREQMQKSGRIDEETTQMKDPEGMGGYNPLKYASVELGQQIIEFCAARIGKKALDVLEGRVEPLEKADKIFMDNPGPTD